MLEIKKVNNLYQARDIASDGLSTNWESSCPMSESDLTNALIQRGFDQRDIQEAFIKSNTPYFTVGQW